MECPNGSICTEIAYDVITLKKAVECSLIARNINYL